MDSVDSPSKAPNETTEVNDILISSPDPGYTFGDANCIISEGRERGQTENYHLDLSKGYKSGDARRARLVLLSVRNWEKSCHQLHMAHLAVVWCPQRKRE